MGKLFALGDVKVCRMKQKNLTVFAISREERKRVVEQVGDSGYTLYSYYRTENFRSSEELQDSYIADWLTWLPSKVKRYRQILEKAGLFKCVRHGTKEEGTTRVWVGEEVVALYNAGLPAEILDGPEFNKLKRELKIQTSEDLVKNVDLMMKLYAQREGLK